MLKKLLVAASLFAACHAQAALVAGDIAIIGLIDNGSPDSFSFVSLADINVGETIYFTDNGWTGSAFRSGSTTDGDGNENLTRWTANQSISAGSIIGSTASSAAWTWATSGAVPGATTGSFAHLALAQGGDQIYAFQSDSANLPLQNPTRQLYVLDDTGAFENATSAGTGDIPLGLTAGSTAITFNFASSRFISVSSSVLSGPAKTKEQWLSVFADSSNWTTASSGVLPTGSIAIAAIPEPETYAMFLAGLGLLGFASRRKQ